MSEELAAVFATPEVIRALDDAALVAAMLSVESALGAACASAGLIPAAAAAEIEKACARVDISPADLADGAVANATPVVPLVALLRAAVPEPHRAHVHFGATSQDILDTAGSLLAARALDLIIADLAATADALAGLAREHAGTVQIGRTLLQQARPTTFGLVCAGWLGALDSARADLAEVRERRLAVQLGGPVGTREEYAAAGDQVAAELARRLGLADPGTPWHTDRQRIGALAGAALLVTGALGSIARTVALLASTEIGELAEAQPGGSSAMPHKRNPARATLVLACVHQLAGPATTLLTGLAVEEQRPAGTWQAELPALRQLLRLLAGAAAHARALVEGLRVDAARMRHNLGDAVPGPALLDSARALVDRALAAHAGEGG
jgi:3-carboxy-cis,cis-muconate cycloisomerase